VHKLFSTGAGSLLSTSALAHPRCCPHLRWTSEHAPVASVHLLLSASDHTVPASLIDTPDASLEDRLTKLSLSSSVPQVRPFHTLKVCPDRSARFQLFEILIWPQSSRYFWPQTHTGLSLERFCCRLRRISTLFLSVLALFRKFGSTEPRFHC